MSEYERLQAQRDAIIKKGRERSNDYRMLVEIRKIVRNDKLNLQQKVTAVFTLTEDI